VDCSNLEYCNYHIYPNYAYRLRGKLGTNRYSRPACHGGLSCYREPDSPRFNLKCFGFRPCLALGGIRWSNQYWLLPGKFSGALLDDLSPTLSLSNSSSTPHSRNIVPGVLVDIKKSLNEKKSGAGYFFLYPYFRII